MSILTFIGPSASLSITWPHFRQVSDPSGLILYVTDPQDGQELLIHGLMVRLGLPSRITLAVAFLTRRLAPSLMKVKSAAKIDVMPMKAHTRMNRPTDSEIMEAYCEVPAALHADTMSIAMSEK